MSDYKNNQGEEGVVALGGQGPRPFLVLVIFTTWAVQRHAQTGQARGQATVTSVGVGESN